MIPDFKAPDGWRVVDYADLPKGTEYRTASGFVTEKIADYVGLNVIVLVRDAQPDPEWLFTHHGERMKGNFGEWSFGVTTVGRMRNRSDLDQWEYADSYVTTWENWVENWEFDQPDDDEFPVIVRRVLR